ncbi:protein associated with UVRAG as autophagy enhancer isoform 2-T2 [Discoglossus pictus]
MSLHAIALTSYNNNKRTLDRANMMQSYSQMKTMDSPNPHLNMLPRIPTIKFDEDELPRPAVIGFGGGCGSYPDSATAIKEILASVLNLTGGLKSKITIQTDFQDGDEEDSDSSCDGVWEDDESDSDSVPLITCPQNDIRFNRAKVSWENPQTDSPDITDPPTYNPKITQVPRDTAQLNCLPFPECDACTEVILTGSVITSQVDMPLLHSIKEIRRFSTPNISNYSLNFGQTPQTTISHVLSLPLSPEVFHTELCPSEDTNLFQRRSQSCSCIQKASEETLTESTESLENATENLFEPTVNLENENAHFLVADLFISVAEKMKSSLQSSHWVQHTMDRVTSCSQLCKKDQEPIPVPMTKNQSESATSVDSGYGGLTTMQQNSPADTIIEEEIEPEHTPVCEEYEDYYEDFVIIDPDYERICKNSNKPTPERPAPEPGSTSAEQIAKKLYRVFRNQWLQLDDELQLSSSPHTTMERLLIQHSIPEEFESSLTLLNEIKKFKKREAAEWSPPRFQIITTIHPILRRNDVVASQNYLCSGCGTKVEPRYTSRLRYCEYLGKYFCDCCHSYEESIIPSQVLMKWSFSKYYVSNFAKNLLDSIYQSHTFNLESENPTLYKKVRDLNRVKELQVQLISIKRLLSTCRFADSVLKQFEDVPPHLTSELHLFTLSDLFKVKQRLLLPALRELLTTCMAHMDDCQLCQARGFICEFCRSDDVIFPFQIEICKRCEVCKACYHKQCFKTKDCPKCRRIEERRVKSESPVSESNEEDPVKHCV